MPTSQPAWLMAALYERARAAKGAVRKDHPYRFRLIAR